MTALPPPPVPRHDLALMADPSLWPTWPFLPLVRRRAGADPDLGVLFDAAAVCDRSGYRCAVFLSNLFTLPRDPEKILALPREVFDTFEELLATGWRVD